MESKKSSYQKLKDRVAELEKEKWLLYLDFKAYAQKTMSVFDATIYEARFKFDDSFENTVWMGESSFFKELKNEQQ